MPTPVEIILARQAELEARDALQAAAAQVISAYVRTYGQIASHVEELAGLCARFGKLQLMAELPADVREAIETSLSALQTLWQTCSPHPFPVMPDEPVVEPVAEPIVEPIDEEGAP